jgi:hypothetical protein
MQDEAEYLRKQAERYRRLSRAVDGDASRTLTSMAEEYEARADTVADRDDDPLPPS